MKTVFALLLSTRLLTAQYPVKSAPGLPASLSKEAKELEALRQLNPELTNVRDYGVKCDGSTDDAINFQNAINSIPLGHTLILPAGVCRISAGVIISQSGFKMYGAGKFATQIYLDNDSGTAITADGTGGKSGLELAGFTVGSWRSNDSVRSAGSSIVVKRFGDYSLRDLNLISGWNTLVLDGAATGQIDNISIGVYPPVNPKTSNLPAGGLHRGVTLINGCVSTRIKNVYINSIGPYEAGVHLDSGTDTVMLEGVELTGPAKYGLILTNEGTKHDPRWVRVLNSFFEPDQKSGIAVQISKGNDLEFVGVYAKGGLVGYRVSNPANIFQRVRGGVVQLMQNEGVLIEAGSEISFDGTLITDNSQSGSGRYAGIRIGSGIKHFSFSHIRSGNVLWHGTPPSLGAWQSHGMLISSGSSDFYWIVDCDFSNNVVGGIWDGGSGRNKIVNGNLPFRRER